ncbi:MAG TPA: molecular chaperone TorD family protein [Acidimicrobiia bacterium]|nr:molecular chaperone TorD family protein [Acidimicrobiia bacterium]
MTSLLLAEPAQVEALGRAAVYALCSHALAAPTPARWAQLHTVVLPAVLALDLGSGLEAKIEGVARFTPPDPSDLKAAHLRLFPPIASQDAPGYETAYRGQDLFQQVDLLADIAGFYRAHGLKPGGGERERVDHIVVELEFCAILARKEAYALGNLGAEEVEVSRSTAASFLRDHLGCWGPAFGRRIAIVAEHPFYRSVGALLAAWIEAHLAQLGLQPAEIADSPLAQAPPDDVGCGPCPLPGMAT